MTIKRNIRFLLLLTAALYVLGACATNQSKVAPISKSMNPIERFNELDTDIGNARNNEVNVLSPTWFAKAERSLREAKELLDRGGELSKVSQKLVDGGAQLRRAEEMAQLARTALPDSIKARKLARAAGATRLGKDYADVEERFLNLTEAIENNNLLWARKKESKVTKAFDHLELRAIKEQTLGEVRTLINQAEGEGARKIAPKTFAVAERRLAEADTFISKNRYQKEEIHKKAADALFQARRLLHVTRQSGKIQKMEPEQITLWIEGILYKTTHALSAPDMRDRTFTMQIENINGSIATLQADHQFMAEKAEAQQTEIDAMENRIASLEGRTEEEKAKKERLAEEKWFNELFNEVQSYFSQNEAEVYKQGNRLVIRLKAMEFPIGKDFIVPGNYSLLSKVQRAIRTFESPRVVIEGHTDSTGSDELNQHLSQQRAEAVRKYFVANGTLRDERVLAVGYGSERPLASNKTATGRSINRRIDLVIMPSPRGTQ
ncbi:MAG: OmpA family protein [Proteobacteria bacterium]|nr:OmpA family protein [Pseudomonadota bacterium]